MRHILPSVKYFIRIVTLHFLRRLHQLYILYILLGAHGILPLVQDVDVGDSSFEMSGHILDVAEEFYPQNLSKTLLAQPFVAFGTEFASYLSKKIKLSFCGTWYNYQLTRLSIKRYYKHDP